MNSIRAFPFVIHPSQIDEKHPLHKEFRQMVARGSAIVSQYVNEDGTGTKTHCPNCPNCDPLT